MRFRSVHGLLVSVAVLCFACQSDGDASAMPDPIPGVDRVEMRDDAFDPQAIAVEPGTTVTWAFTDDGVSHNVVGDMFESAVQSDGLFHHTFTERGTYLYRCTLHRGMDGLVEVVESQAS